MKRVLWAEAATKDLAEIKAWLSENYSASIADQHLGRLIRAAHWLLDQPHAGPPIGVGNWRKWKPRGVRHLLIYQPGKDGIEVLRVHHERNDWRKVPTP